MNKKFPIPLPVLVLMISASFLAGSIWQKSQVNPQVNQSTQKALSQNYRFQPKKTTTPEIKLFFQSFSQEDIELQTNLITLVEEFGQQVTWQPHYLFSESSNPSQINNCLATETNSFYCSPQGKNQLNQNVREICAWRFANNKLQWWKFVNSIYQNCTLSEIDTCWQEQAKEANLPSNQIQNCFSTQAVEIIQEEITAFNNNSINQTPVILINDIRLPFSTLTANAKNVVKIGNNYFSGEELNSPEYLRAAVCASFKDKPELCK